MVDSPQLALAWVFCSHDHPGVDLAELDHIGDDQHTIKETQTGVDDVEAHSGL